MSDEPERADVPIKTLRVLRELVTQPRTGATGCFHRPTPPGTPTPPGAARERRLPPDPRRRGRRRSWRLGANITMRRNGPLARSPGPPPLDPADALLRAARAALSAEGIGDVVLFLASDAARCTCGTLVEINGGKSVS
ncbi:hypothetical protein GCM10027174_31000 [Salinifilum aidingensis]